MNSTSINGASSSGNGGRIVSWYDLQNMTPKNPLDLIAFSSLGGITGQLINSTDFANAPGTTSRISISTGTVPVCDANGDDDEKKKAEASQWNMSHLTRYATAGTIPPSLNRLLFMRGGLEWKMTISLSFAANCSGVELSFLMNAATRGDAQGTIPVISFPGSFTSAAPYNLIVTLREFGQVRMGIRALDGSSNSAMFEMEWVMVP
jgi:hypothetical protein